MTRRQMRIGAYGIAHQDGQVLLARASASSDLPRTWWLPGGGLDFGECPEEACVREVFEETGLNVAVSGPPQVFSDRGTAKVRDVDLHAIRIVYPVTVLGGELRAEVGGSTDLAQWISLPDAARLPMLPFVRISLGL